MRNTGLRIVWRLNQCTYLTLRKITVKDMVLYCLNEFCEFQINTTLISMHLTVPEEVPESIAFFEKKGFIIKGKSAIQLKPGSNEYLLQYKTK